MHRNILSFTYIILGINIYFIYSPFPKETITLIVFIDSYTNATGPQDMFMFVSNNSDIILLSNYVDNVSLCLYT